MKFSTHKLITHHLTRNWHPILMGIKWVYRLKATPESRLHRLTVSCSLSLFSFLCFFIFIYGIFFVFSALMQNQKVWLPSQLKWIVQTTRSNTIYGFQPSTHRNGLLGPNATSLLLKISNRPSTYPIFNSEPHTLVGYGLDKVFCCRIRKMGLDSTSIKKLISVLTR